ncbi:MAG: helix-turn-helix domain-containing protein [Candidatus Buchananbacteria bacterium]|nr:helix-turn-helix domain-containing protein [Candidatus Buchananbacteria bacterium]
MPQGILTIGEVAKLMHVSLKTVYRWVNDGQLPAARIGYKTYRVFENDLIKFLRRNMTSSGRKKR